MLSLWVTQKVLILPSFILIRYDLIVLIAMNTYLKEKCLICKKLVKRKRNLFDLKRKLFDFLKM